MTKLKTPITLTIETIEDAVRLRVALNVPESTRISTDPDKNAPPPAIAANRNSGGLNPRRKIEEQLTAQGIDWKTWLPGHPFKIAGRECTFHPNGTVTVSGATTIANDEINEFLKRRKAAMGIAEWPKYYVAQNNVVWRWRHDGDFGQCWENGHWNTPTHASTDDRCKPGNCKPIAQEEAAAIIGAGNLLKHSQRFATATVAAGSVAPQRTPPEDAQSLAATADLFDALKGLYEAVRMLRAETISIDNTRKATKDAILKASR